MTETSRKIENTLGLKGLTEVSIECAIVVRG